MNKSFKQVFARECHRRRGLVVKGEWTQQFRAEFKELGGIWDQWEKEWLMPNPESYELVRRIPEREQARKAREVIHKRKMADQERQEREQRLADKERREADWGPVWDSMDPKKRPRSQTESRQDTPELETVPSSLGISV